jgi:hypothetical protein
VEEAKTAEAKGRETVKFIVEYQDGPVKKYVNSKFGWTYQRNKAIEFLFRKAAEQAVKEMGGYIVEVDA